MKINSSGNFVIRVDIPALTDLVAFLQGGQQAQIDALTSEVGALTQRLKRSNEGLQQAVVTESK